MIATIYCLLYGDHLELHKRLVGSLEKYLPRGEARVVIWCNTVGKDTANYLTLASGLPGPVIYSKENVPKYEVMRRLFRRGLGLAPTTEWVIWFDDDSYVTKADWWAKTKAYLAAKKAENICYMGQPWYVHHLPGQWDFIKQAEWFKGLPPEQCPTRTKGVNKPGINFAQGAYWWLRLDVLQQLNWPDVRLNHNGGDTLLGEAVRQQGLPFHRFHYGVKLNDARRRGFHEAPAGSNKNVRR